MLIGGQNLLRVEIQVRSIYLVEPPQKIFGSAIDVVATGVIRKVGAQR